MTDIQPPFSAYDYSANSEPFVFASYAHSDKQQVYPIIQRLYKEGINIWYDKGIPLSSEWRKEITDALKHCSKFLVFLSNTSVTRPNVIREINFILDRYDRGEVGVCPVYLEEIRLPDDLHFSMGHIQALFKYNMDSERFFRKILKSMSKKDSQRDQNSSQSRQYSTISHRGGIPQKQFRNQIKSNEFVELTFISHVNLNRRYQMKFKQTKIFRDIQSNIHSQEGIRRGKINLKTPDGKSFDNADWDLTIGEIVEIYGNIFRVRIRW